MKKKGLLIAIFVAILIVFDYIVPTIDISKRAVVIGIGLDEIDGKMSVSAQILSRKKGEIGFEYYSAEGDDFDSCVSNLSAKVGAKLSLAHTLCMVISDKDKAVESLDKIAKTGVVSDSCYLFATNTSASKVVESVDKEKTPLVKILRDSASMRKRDIGISVCNIREYICDISSVGGCVSIPIVELREQEVVSESSLIVQDGKAKHRLDDIGNMAICMVESRVLDSSLYVPKVDTSYQIHSAKLVVDCPSVDDIGLTLQVKATRSGKSLDQDEKQALGECIKEMIVHSVSESISHNLDFLKLGQKIRSHHPKQWKNSQDYLQNIRVGVDVKMVVN